MATTEYFNQEVEDTATGTFKHLEIGTTSCDGLQVYLYAGTENIVLNHEDAKKFISAAKEIERYFGY